MAEGDGEPAGDATESERADDADPTGPLARGKTALTEAVGLVVDAVLDAL
ncbi:hypothetical protein [Halorubrum sp. CBA1229]|jgi:hypothetical protein|nr:hypothetical protein [Halorubrum sp. CBA1229]QKY17656.1 hypothetical protein Hrr1229_012430 [Halorubrum sp. CBA1229]